MVCAMTCFPQPHVEKYAPVYGEDLISPSCHLSPVSLHAPRPSACSLVLSPGQEMVCHVDQTLIL